MKDTQSKALSALDHVQETYPEEFLLYLEAHDYQISEESALLFLERVETDIPLES